MNKYGLDGKGVVITGGAGGIGRAIASLLLRSNAKVSLWDLSGEALEAAVRDLSSISAGALTKHWMDVTDDAAIARAVAADRSSFGRIDARTRVLLSGTVQPSLVSSAPELPCQGS
jgi:2-dehydro-3-deoxy-L-rhamnonate dehydrogenase (NAD+)